MPEIHGFRHNLLFEKSTLIKAEQTGENNCLVPIIAKYSSSKVSVEL